MELYGYQRSDGRAGFRNHVLVLPLTGCEGEVARRIADQVPGTTCLAHPHGCDLQGADDELFGALLLHFATHPNVGGVLFLAMGCTAALRHRLPERAKEAGRLVHMLNTQTCGGTTAAIAAGAAAAREMVAELAQVRRVPVPFSTLVVGTKCGASDPNSFTTCHPVVGKACDLLVAQGATVVLSEDCELVAGASALARRAATADIAARLRQLPKEVNRAWKKRFGYTLRQLVTDGGTSLEQWRKRSLEHALKAGSGPITGFFDMSEQVRGPGLVVLNAPNTDLECVTCLAAAGCQVTIFTTGRGTRVGSPTAITLKVTATQKTFELMAENIDVCVAGATTPVGTETVEAAAARVAAAVVAAANGQLSKAEVLRHWENAIPIRGVTF